MWVISTAPFGNPTEKFWIACSSQYIEGNLVGNLNFGGCPPPQLRQTNQPLPLWAWNSEEWPAFGGCCTALKYMGYPLALSSDSARLELVQNRETWQSWPRRSFKKCLIKLLWQVFFVEDFCSEGLDRYLWDVLFSKMERLGPARRSC